MVPESIPRNEAIARFRWLPPQLRPPPGMGNRQEGIVLLVGMAILYAGYDMSIYGFAMPQIQMELRIPEDQAALTIAYFRMAALVALLICATADIVGRRRLLMITILGQTIGTIATAFAADHSQFIWLQVITRVFGYSEEMLCVVILTEEASANARGWANGMLSALYFVGSTTAALVFALVNLLPYGWRAIYLIGAVPLILLAYARRRLPETERFQVRMDELRQLKSRAAAALDLSRRLASEYPGRLFAILAASGIFGFAIAPASALGFKYMQQSLGYSPLQTTSLYVLGGSLAIWLSVIAGRWSDRAGRKLVIGAMAILSAGCFTLFFSGLRGWFIPPVWILAYFGYFAADALFTGYALEIMPTAYRATISGISFTVRNLIGAISLVLEGYLYNMLGSHGLAVIVPLTVMPIALVAFAFLPDPAGKTLEELTERPPLG